MPELILYSTDKIGQYVLMSVYELLDLDEAIYISAERVPNNDYTYKGSRQISHILSPVNGDYIIDNININITDLNINDKTIMINCSDKEFNIIKKIIIKSNDKKILKDFIEKCYNERVEQLKAEGILSNDKIYKKVYTKYGWVNHSIIPKRDLNTVFLKKGQIDNIKDKILDFIKHDTYVDYIKHGIPYKYNILLHGKPGVGKTTLIHSMASLCNANICVLNINTELKEADFIDAFRNSNEQEGLTFIVIEDIDCIFEDRKTNDTLRNQITMQGLLNCMDGFNNQEGVILILTTNYPKKLDTAMMRSGRVDLMIELTNVDKFQAHNMYNSFFSNDDDFNNLWNEIKNKDVPPCMLQEFLFNNRKSKDGVYNKINDLIKILEQKNLNMYN